MKGKIKRKIPCCMATQHPDAASKYIPIQEEPEEALISLKEQHRHGFGCDEYMVDYEGKLTPYHQVAQITTLLIENNIIPGEDAFITPRIPSASKENVFRQLMALMSIIEADFKAREEIGKNAVLEIIHPMTEDAEELIKAEERINIITRIAKEELNVDIEGSLNIIPLIEEVPELFEIKSILSEFIEKRKNKSSYLRVLIGRSDPALSYGLCASVIACKLAIAGCYEVSMEEDIEIYPILGAGSLPFRGHVSPDNIRNIVREYAGARTITIQSALRYDYDYREAKKLINYLKENLQNQKPINFSEEEKEELEEIACYFAVEYIKTLSLLNHEIISAIAEFLPNQRDRLTTKGALGYARDLPKPEKLAEIIKRKNIAKELKRITQPLFSLPRAIKFTGAFYTIGMPPEFIGTGRAFERIRKELGESYAERFLKKYYPSLTKDLEFASCFLNLKIARSFIPEKAFEMLKEDVNFCKNLGIEIEKNAEKEPEYHHNMERLMLYLRSIIIDKEKILDIEEKAAKEIIIRLAKIRRALG